VRSVLLTPASTFEEALEIAYEKLGTKLPSVAVLPYATGVFPK